MDSHLVQVLLPRLKELEDSCHNLFVLSTEKKNAPCWWGGRKLLHHKLLRHQIRMSQEYMYIRKTHNFPLISLWSANFKMREVVQKLVSTHTIILFSRFEAKHHGYNCTTKRYPEHYIKSLPIPDPHARRSHRTPWKDIWLTHVL
jgi:hypothetical protein